MASLSTGPTTSYGARAVRRRCIVGQATVPTPRLSLVDTGPHHWRRAGHRRGFRGDIVATVLLHAAERDQDPGVQVERLSLPRFL